MDRLIPKQEVMTYLNISRKTFEMNHTKIESVNVDQGILGRILGYGTLRIVGSGGSKEVFPKIQSPLEFRKKFQEMLQ